MNGWPAPLLLLLCSLPEQARGLQCASLGRTPEAACRALAATARRRRDVALRDHMLAGA